MDDFEVICVDDGSTDSSPEILSEYENKDRRVKVLRQENRHAGIARNNGLLRATGEYVHFLDSDDWIESRMYETMCGIIEKYQADVAICFYEKFDDMTEEVKK